MAQPPVPARRARSPPSQPPRPSAEARQHRPRRAGPVRGGSPPARGGSLAQRHLAAARPRSQDPPTLAAGRCVPTWRKPRRGGLLDPYRDHLERRWSEGCHNAARLWRELVAPGLPWPSSHRGSLGDRTAQGGAERVPAVPAEGKPWRPPSGRRVARLLMADAGAVVADQAFAMRLLEEVPALAATIAAAKRLEAVLRRHERRDARRRSRRRGGHTAGRLRRRAAQGRPCRGSRAHLPWTTSPAEGQIGRIKMIKCTMYGRAGFELLRARVLHAA